MDTHTRLCLVTGSIPFRGSTARLCVCELECVFFILVESGGEEGQRVQTKVGFPLVPLNQQQLFGTFNNY